MQGPQSLATGSQLVAVKRVLDAHSHRRHVGVAKAIVNNNPETVKLRRRRFPAAAGCAPPQAAEALACGHETPRAAAPPDVILVNTLFWKILVTRVKRKYATQADLADLRACVP